MGLLGMTDLLGINLDEATALASRTAEGTMPEAVVEAAVGRLRELNPGIQVSITAGKQGSWTWDGESLAYLPALPVEVASTAGAGDAHLAGLIVGLAAGLEMHQAHELATLVAALSVTSPHTINPDVSWEALSELANRAGMELSFGFGERP
jgi:ribokinase